MNKNIIKSAPNSNYYINRKNKTIRLSTDTYNSASNNNHNIVSNGVHIYFTQPLDHPEYTANKVHLLTHKFPRNFLDLQDTDTPFNPFVVKDFEEFKNKFPLVYGKHLYNLGPDPGIFKDYAEEYGDKVDREIRNLGKVTEYENKHLQLTNAILDDIINNNKFALGGLGTNELIDNLNKHTEKIKDPYIKMYIKNAFNNISNLKRKQRNPNEIRQTPMLGQLIDSIITFND